MQIEIKRFEELNLDELYNILQLRSEVFVVEQNCVYQDIDGKDRDALHILGKKDGKIIAYTRCFDSGYYYEAAAIGRVVVKMNQRKFGYGHRIMIVSIEAIKTHFKTEKIKLSAQRYLTAFYETHGFQQTGEPYLEDGIPHIAMVNYAISE